VACGGGSVEARGGGADLSDAARDWNAAEASRQASARLSRSTPSQSVRRPRSASGTERSGSLRSHLVDVRFDDADLHNALRFLADEAGVSLVIGDGVSGRVDDRLERVDAYEALVTLARAHGATIERRDRVVIVRAP
jgi:type II secretory pathway component HofQ